MPNQLISLQPSFNIGGRLDTSLARPPFEWLTNSDSFGSNCIYNKEGDEVVTYRRPAFHAYNLTFQYTAAIADGHPRGIFQNSTDTYVVYDQSYTKVSGPLPGGGAPYVKTPIPFMGAGDTGSVYSLRLDPFTIGANTYTTVLKSASGMFFLLTPGDHVTSASYPATTLPGLAYLDGSLYVMDTLGNIRGSNPYDYATWDPLNTIKTQTADTPVGIFKHLNYIVAVYKNSLQFYYNAGNPTGSPLSPVSSGSIPVGSSWIDTFVTINGLTFFLGNTSHDQIGYGVYSLDGLSLSKVSNPSVDYISSGSPQSHSNDVYFAFPFRINGHDIYMLQRMHKIDKYLCLTLAFDLTSGNWHPWGMGIPSLPDSTYWFMDVCYPFYDESLQLTRALVYFRDGSVWSNIYLDGQLQYDEIMDSVPVPTPIRLRIQTPPVTLGSAVRKFISATYLHLNYPGGQAPFETSFTITLKYADSFPIIYTAPVPTCTRTFTVPTTNGEVPRINRCGSTRSRVFQLEFTGRAALGFKALELEIEPGP